MKTISISTATFAAIWAARQSGEDSEEEILARLLDAGSPESKQDNLPKPQPKVMLHKQKMVKPMPVARAVEDKPAKPASNCMSTADLDLLS